MLSFSFFILPSSLVQGEYMMRMLNSGSLYMYIFVIFAQSLIGNWKLVFACQHFQTFSNIFQRCPFLYLTSSSCHLPYTFLSSTNSHVTPSLTLLGSPVVSACLFWQLGNKRPSLIIILQRLTVQVLNKHAVTHTLPDFSNPKAPILAPDWCLNTQGHRH